MIHDTHMHTWIPPTLMHYVTGTYADAAGQVSNTIVKKRSAHDSVGTITIPILIPMNDGPQKGVYITSIDIYWETITAALDALSALIYLAALPADTAAFAAPASQAFSYDTGHDTANERLTQDQHTMTLTLTTPLWIEDDQLLSVEMSVDSAATSVFDMIGARVNYTLRL